MNWNLNKLDLILMKWIHEEPDNIEKVERRAFMIAISPLLIGGGIAWLIITTAELLG